MRYKHPANALHSYVMRTLPILSLFIPKSQDLLRKFIDQKICCHSNLSFLRAYFSPFSLSLFPLPPFLSGIFFLSLFPFLVLPFSHL